MAYNAGSQSGNLVLLSKQTASASSSIDFTSLISSAYDYFKIEFYNMTFSAGNNLFLRMSTNNGSTYSTTTYSTTQLFGNSGGQTTRYVTTDAGHGLTLAWTTNANVTGCGSVIMYNLNSGTLYKQFITQCSYSVGADQGYLFSTGMWSTGTAANAVRIIPDAGTITTGTFKLYGVQN